MAKKPYPLPFLSNRSVVVLGLGNSGKVSLQAAIGAGAKAMGTDDSAVTVRKVRDLGLPVTDKEEVLTDNETVVVVSPGVPTSHPIPHPIVTKARAKQATLTSDIDLFFQNRPIGKVIGVSGTNGKSSTVSLIHFILEIFGQDTQLGGNIGVPVLSLRPDASHTVLELSSYQIEMSPHLDCDVSVLLKLAPDHLDRYASYEAYTKSKLRLLYPPAEGLAHGFTSPKTRTKDMGELKNKGLKYSIYDQDDTLQCGFVKDYQPHSEGVVFVPCSVTSIPYKGFAILEGRLHDTFSQPEKQFCLSRHHMIQPKPTLLAAYASLRVLGQDAEAIFDASKLWPGLSHRMEVVKLSLNDDNRTSLDSGIMFINDSKATNMASVAYALSRIREGHFSGEWHQEQACFWLCGGQLKQDDDMNQLVPYLSAVTKAFTFGSGASHMLQFLKGHQVRVVDFNSMESALEDAVDIALEWIKPNFARGSPKPIVLLSPGGASFDAYKNFMERGNAFKNQIDKMFK